MKIGEIEKQACGDCPLIEWCGEPFDDLCLCTDKRLENIDVEEYIKLAESSDAVCEIDTEEDETYNDCRWKEAVCEDVFAQMFC